MHIKAAKIMKWIFLLNICLSQVEFSVLPVISSILIAGRPISFYLHYFVWAVSLLLLVVKAIRKPISIWEFLLLTGCVYTYTITVFYQRPLGKVLTESGQFLVPLLIFEYISAYKISYKEMLYTLFVTSAVCGVISLLVATGTIETDIWAAEGDYIRSAGVVDGTCGVACFVASIVVLSNKRENYSLALAIIGLVGSILTIVFGFSRLRIIICVVLLAIFFFMNQQDSKQKKTVGRKYLFFTLIMIGSAIYLAIDPEPINRIGQMLTKRFETLGQDGSSQVRINEVAVHLDILWKSFGMGHGWGFRHLYAVGDSVLFPHIVYSGILMHMGLIFGTAYILYLGKILRDATREYLAIQCIENQINLLELILVILVGFGGGGITQSGAWLIMALVYAKRNEKRPLREISKN